MNRIFFFLSLTAIFIFSQGCNINKKIKKTPDKMSSSELIDYLNAHQNTVDWLFAKAKITLNHPDLTMSFFSTIKLENGKSLWANGKKMGFEAGRMLIQEDSVFIINRLERSYMAEGLDYLERNNLPEGLPAVQQLLLGNPVLNFDGDYTVNKAKNGIKISGQYQGVNMVYFYEIPSLILTKVIFEQPERDKKLELHLNEYALIDEKINFAYLRNISVQNGDERFNAEIKFSKVEIDVPQDIKFSIPAHYSKTSF